MKNTGKTIPLTGKGILLLLGILFIGSYASLAQNKAVFVDMNRHIVKPADSLASSRQTPGKSSSDKAAKPNTFRMASKDTGLLVRSATQDSIAYFRKWRSDLRPNSKH